mgnify:CR=1 FL=1
MNAHNLIALPEGVAGAGLICWWELKGRTDPELVADALDSRGLDMTPPGTSAAESLRQAMQSAAGPRAARQHGVICMRRDKFSWFLVERALIANGDDVSLAAFARVEVTPDGDDFESYVLRSTGDFDLVDAIIVNARSLMATTASTSISSWVSAVHRNTFKATALRSQGGFYYVPPSERDTWQAFWDALHETTAHRASSIDALPTEQTIAAIVSSVRREYETALDELDLDVLNHRTGIQKRVKQSRLERCSELQKKLAAYVDIVGGSLSDLSDALATVGALIAVLPET